MKTRFHPVLLGAMIACCGEAWSLTDPTRPPAAFQVGEVAVEATDGLRLQSVKIPQHGRGVAVINGVTVSVGGHFGEKKLIRLSEREAVLTGLDGVTHLYLIPDVEKQMIVVPGTRKSHKTAPRKDAQ